MKTPPRINGSQTIGPRQDGWLYDSPCIHTQGETAKLIGCTQQEVSKDEQRIIKRLRHAFAFELIECRLHGYKIFTQ